jgi:hypothetical protein
LNNDKGREQAKCHYLAVANATETLDPSGYAMAAAGDAVPLSGTAVVALAATHLCAWCVRIYVRALRAMVSAAVSVAWFVAWQLKAMAHSAIGFLS